MKNSFPHFSGSFFKPNSPKIPKNCQRHTIRYLLHVVGRHLRGRHGVGRRDRAHRHRSRRHLRGGRRGGRGCWKKGAGLVEPRKKTPKQGTKPQKGAKLTILLLLNIPRRRNRRLNVAPGLVKRIRAYRVTVAVI